MIATSIVLLLPSKRYELKRLFPENMLQLLAYSTQFVEAEIEVLMGLDNLSKIMMRAVYMAKMRF